MGFFNLFSSPDKIRAKKIFEIYKEIRSKKHKVTRYEIFTETAFDYYRSLGMEEALAKHYSEIVVGGVEGKGTKDLKFIAQHILDMGEYASQSLSSLGGFLRSSGDLDKYESRTNAVEEAYREVFKD